MKAKINYKQLNSKRILCESHIINECRKLVQKKYITRVRLGGKINPQETVQEIKNLTILINSTCTNQNMCKKMGFIKFSGILRNKWITQFWPEMQDLLLIHKKKRICHMMDFADYSVKRKESEKIEKFLDFARELKRL